MESLYCAEPNLYMPHLSTTFSVRTLLTNRALCTLCTVYCTACIVYCTFCIVHCTLSTVHCPMCVQALYSPLPSNLAACKRGRHVAASLSFTSERTELEQHCDSCKQIATMASLYYPSVPQCPKLLPMPPPRPRRVLHSTVLVCLPT